MENADLLTNAAAALEWARGEEQLLETEVTVLQARLELVRELVTRLSGKPRARRGRPPGPKLVENIEMPLRVTGGISQPEPESAA